MKINFNFEKKHILTGFGNSLLLKTVHKSSYVGGIIRRPCCLVAL